MHVQSFLIYYLLFNSEQDIRAVVMMARELQDEFWGTRFSFSMVRFLFVCYLMGTMWQRWLRGCVCAIPYRALERNNLQFKLCTS